MNKITTYLYYLTGQKSPGLIIYNSDDKLTELEGQVRGHAILKADNWQGVLSHLEKNHSAYIILKDNFPKELYDTLVQFDQRGGCVQIMDKDTFKLKTVQFDPDKTHLLLLASSKNLAEIEKTYNIRGNVGPVELME